MDNNIVTEPTFLDGSVTPRGQGQEGNFDLLDQLRNKEYAGYVCYAGQSLTDEDYMDLWSAESKLNDLSCNGCPSGGLCKCGKYSYQKWLLQERVSKIWEKIDMDATIQLTNRKLEEQRRNANKNKHAGHELGAREFTFTYSPKWFTDEEAREHMRKAISKLIKYYSDEIIQLRAVGEVGSNGLSHVHCFYKLRGGLKISDKNFKRAYKYWNPKKVTSRTGHEGGHHANVRVESDFQGYIDKDVDTAWLDVYYPDTDPTV